MLVYVVLKAAAAVSSVEGKSPPPHKKVFLGYDIKRYLVARLQFWDSRGLASIVYIFITLPTTSSLIRIVGISSDPVHMTDNCV